MSVTDNRAISAQRAANSVLNRPLTGRDQCGGFDDTPAGTTDRDALLAHLGRDVIHASRTRNFSNAYYTDNDGQRQPRMYRVQSEAFAQCQYVMLTNKQYASVLVVDIDRQGSQGGHPSSLAPDVRGTFKALNDHFIGPAWIGINPMSGKAQALWLIDPVYADESGKSRHMNLLAATSRALGELLDHDPHFAHRFSRSPFYTGDDPTAYRWYCQHKRVHRLGDLIREVRMMTGQSQYEKDLRQQFTSGRDLINAVKARREEAQRFKSLADEIENEIGPDMDRYDPELVDGVRILWISTDTAARDETAFRHALKSGHRLRASGKRMTDAALIDAYEHAYNVAQRVGAAGRPSEMPPMRDRQTMARRVRSYVTQSNSGQQRVTNTGHTTSSERKALATMGRKGGKVAAQRWKTDPNGHYAQNQRKKLAKTQRKKKIQGTNNRQRIGQFVTSYWIETDRIPTWREIEQETGLSRATVARHMAALKNSGELPDQ